MSEEMETMARAQEKIVEEFSYLDDWLDRYQEIIDLGQELAPGSESLHRDEHLIKGCQSRVWIRCQLENGRLHFEADSDTVITKGIAAILLKVVNDRTPGEILATPLHVVDGIGLKENLSPTRANGLVAMVERIYECAKKYNT